MTLPRTVPLPNAIKEEHRRLFNLLLEVNQTRQVGAILRVAGGWVRDAMLGRPSNDIDVAIESSPSSERHITGEVFAKEISAYQLEHATGPTKSISVIKVNPEKSKHIETAQLTVLDTPLEFCHLRHDEYCNVTRVPTVRPGTPCEDALRRDFTVNALFYNLHTNLVEDFTTGLEDLEMQTLRCPLDPRETFMDDPLRMLRGIRFAGQLGFVVHDSVVTCVDATLIDALEKKVSRERLGIEWIKMMGGQAPHLCWSYIERMGLTRVVLQEQYYSKARGKGVVAVVERESSLIPSDEAEQEVVAQMWRLLTTLVLPLLTDATSRSAVVQEGKEDRLTCSMFLLALPAMQHSSSDERVERLAAWSTSGLKLPIAIASGIRRMLDAVDCLWRNQAAVSVLMQTTQPLSSSSSTTGFEWVGEARDGMFDALVALNDRAVPRNALSVLVAATIVTALHRDGGVGSIDAEDVGRMAGNAMRRLEADQGGLLMSATCALPLQGNEIPALLSVAAKETGKFLLYARRYVVHNPTASREDVVAHLAHVKAQCV